MLALWLPLLLLASQLSFPEKRVKTVQPPAVLDAVDKVWDRGQHNAFTDLVYYRGRFFLVFREGSSHVSPDGAIRVLVSIDGDRWYPHARLDYPVADLRDPKITVTPDNQLMLLTGGAMHPPSDYRFKSFVWFSRDGSSWTPAVNVAEPNIWLWRAVWNEGKAYGLGYGAADDQRVFRTYISPNGSDFQVLNPSAAPGDYPNEAAAIFLPGDRGVCLLRRDGKQNTGLLGFSRPPYRAWEWKDTGVRVGGPNLIRLPDGRVVAVVRLYDGRTRTAVCLVDLESAKLTEVITLPSGGDTSYAGLVYHNDKLYISYYSSHEGRTSIYVAKVKFNR